MNQALDGWCTNKLRTKARAGTIMIPRSIEEGADRRQASIGLIMRLKYNKA